jgi:dTDP-4-amino-4,6-dideoxy-D-galactose acyltransferase
MSELCTLLPWDAEHWGFPVARITAHRLTQDAARQAIEWCERRKVRCLYFAADGRCAQTLQCAAANGFRFVDMRVDMEKCSTEELADGADGNCRDAVPEDLTALKQLARTAHEDTRFFKDVNFDRLKAGDLYALWIERDLLENKVFTAFAAEDPQTLLGYASASTSGSHGGHIGLVAISPEARGRGLGRLLVQRAVGWCRSREADSVRVATQGTNVAALRLYENCGFRVVDAKVWFHRWFAE